MLDVLEDGPSRVVTNEFFHLKLVDNNVEVSSGVVEDRHSLLRLERAS